MVISRDRDEWSAIWSNPYVSELTKSSGFRRSQSAHSLCMGQVSFNRNGYIVRQRQHLDRQGFGRHLSWTNVFIEQQVVARPLTLICIDVKSFHQSELAAAEELTEAGLHRKYHRRFFRDHNEPDAIKGYEVIQVLLRM